MRACMRACVRARVRACARACVCVWGGGEKCKTVVLCCDVICNDNFILPSRSVYYVMNNLDAFDVVLVLMLHFSKLLRTLRS